MVVKRTLFSEIVFELFVYLCHLFDGKQFDMSGLQNAPILLAQRFDFDGDRHGMFKTVTQRDHAVMRHQASVPFSQRRQHRIRNSWLPNKAYGAQGIVLSPVTAIM